MSGKTSSTLTKLPNAEELQLAVDQVVSSSRRSRQKASRVISAVAKENPEALVPHIPALVSVLDFDEAQTRWEVLDALALLVSYDSRACDKALEGAETALFDEDNGPVRLSALRFLCKLGATTENRSEKVWPLLDEAIQCYHGDFEFQDMLAAVVDFSAGKISQNVKEQLGVRMAFDAANAKGWLRKRAAQIVENVSK